MYAEEKNKSQKREFQLKDPFRDPFATDSPPAELNYVDVDVNADDIEQKRTTPSVPSAKATIYHQLLNGTTTPLSTRPAIGVVIPNHSVPAEVPKSMPAVISVHLKPQAAVIDPDIPPPLPLRSAAMMPAPKVTPRGEYFVCVLTDI
jgi:hypothetical protein